LSVFTPEAPAIHNLSSGFRLPLDFLMSSPI
jgi:hypothetical protein